MKSWYYRLPYWILLTGSLCWVGLIFYPLLDSLGGSAGWLSPFIYLFFKPICHQNLERCLYVAGVPLPVCARCLGVYLGGLSGLLCWGLIRGTDSCRVIKEGFIVMGLLPMFLDGLLNLGGFYTSPAWLRCATGFLSGATIAWVLAPGCASVLVPGFRPYPEIKGARV